MRARTRARARLCRYLPLYFQKFAQSVVSNHWLDENPIYREKLGSLDDLKDPRERLKELKKNKNKKKKKLK